MWADWSEENAGNLDVVTRKNGGHGLATVTSMISFKPRIAS